ncbi:MAG: hypothetical protein ACOC40_03025 [Thermoplasmatota archaeon]
MFTEDIELEKRSENIVKEAAGQFKRDKDFELKSSDENSIDVKFGDWWSYKDDLRGSAEIGFHPGKNKATLDFNFQTQIIFSSILIYLPILLVIGLSLWGGIYPFAILFIVILLIFFKYHHYCFSNTAKKYRRKIKDILYIVGSDEFTFCPNCGKKVDISEDWGEENCPICGAELKRKIGKKGKYRKSEKTSKPRPMEFGEEVSKTRPTGITILSVLFVVNAFMGLLTVAFPNIVFSFLPSLLGKIGIVVLVVQSVVLLLAAYGLWRGLSWARIIAIIFAVVGLLNFITGTIVNILILFYLFKDEVKEYFE